MLRVEMERLDKLWKEEMKFEDVINLIAEPNRTKCWALYRSNEIAFNNVPGSVSKHQAWTGGYMDHIVETVQIAQMLYQTLGVRSLSFSLEEAILVLFLHDVEKVWKYRKQGRDKVPILRTKAERKQFVLNKIAEFDIQLNSAQRNALRCIEGEGDDYNPDFRAMFPLGAFCHCCDTLSSRLWFDEPERSGSLPDA